jgi:hypothetical protein
MWSAPWKVWRRRPRLANDRMELHTTLVMTLLSTTGLRQETNLQFRGTLAIATELGDVDYQLQALWALCSYALCTGEI